MMSSGHSFSDKPLSKMENAPLVDQWDSLTIMYKKIKNLNKQNGWKTQKEIGHGLKHHS